MGWRKWDIVVDRKLESGTKRRKTIYTSKMRERETLDRKIQQTKQIK